MPLSFLTCALLAHPNPYSQHIVIIFHRSIFLFSFLQGTPTSPTSFSLQQPFCCYKTLPRGKSSMKVTSTDTRAPHLPRETNPVPWEGHSCVSVWAHVFLYNFKKKISRPQLVKNIVFPPQLPLDHIPPHTPLRSVLVAAGHVRSATGYLR